MTRALARLVVRLRFVLVTAWIAGAVAATLLLPALGESGASPLGGLVPNDAKAIQAREHSLELFTVPLLSEIAVVQRDPHGLGAYQLRRTADLALSIREQHAAPDLRGIVFALPAVNEPPLFPRAREQGTTSITWLLFDPALGLGEQVALAHRYEEHLARDRPGEVTGVTGAGPARLTEVTKINDALPLIEGATVALIALVLGVMFRAPGPPLAALVSAGLAYLVAIRVITWVGGRLGVEVPQEVEPLVVVLILGIVTDYAIFFLSGMRRQLDAGEPRLQAAEGATVAHLPIVVTAGLIVAAGTGALLAGTLEFFRAFGPGLALTALVGLAVSVTLVPALLAIFGRLLFWPSRPRPVRRLDDGRASRLAHLSASRPAAALIALATLAVLLGAATGLRHLDLGFTLIRGLPPGAEAREAALAAGEGFAPGIVAPTEVIVERPGVAADRDALVRFQELVERQPGVAAVLGPREAPQAITRGAVVSRDGSAARLAVVLDQPAVGGDAIHDFERLQTALPGLARQAGLAGARLELAGDTALAQETVSSTVDDLERISIAALGVNVLLLVIFLRSLVAPLFLVASSVLALGATLGLTSYLFLDLLGHDEVTYYVPFAAAVLLVSLGSDYNVFVVGKIADEARRRPIREAVAIAAPRASRAISIAGLALAASFALLAIVPLRTFRELAFTLAVGVLVDAFVVRSALVPALIALVGDASWWPLRRRREAAQGAPSGGGPHEPDLSSRARR